MTYFRIRVAGVCFRDIPPPGIIPPQAMTHHTSPRVRCARGLTLIELSLAISALLVLIALLFIGSRAWKRGCDRASCVLTLRNTQMATRSYQNLYGYDFGGRPYAEDGTQDIASHLYAKGYIEQKLFRQAHGLESCPGGGVYSCPTPDVFPVVGELYMKCSLAETDEHFLPSEVDW